ncbi:lipoyl(octanoyl) transferase LipB [Luteococcus peritonei]|uniref:Octanoyltransferase n=1 Tax=Luteococcus peritonei TaxID=88874 RepID=A0ABW4RY70_9ACTN
MLHRVTVEFEYLGLDHLPPRRMEYHRAWQRQREVHELVSTGQAPDRVLFVEHDAVYTAGRQTLAEERPFDGTPVVDVDRGGKITWHGPGQLVGYPIVRLPDRVGVVDHVRRVEQAVIDVLALYGIQAGRVPGRTGVWLPADDPSTVTPAVPGASHHAKSTERTGNYTPGVPDAEAIAPLQLSGVLGQPAPAAPRTGRPERKICAIGIRVTRRTTMHGFAINVDNESAGFDNIVPCGIPDAGVTTMAAEMAGPPPSLHELATALEPLLTTHLSREGNLSL